MAETSDVLFVIKRSGDKVPFDREKVTRAVSKTFLSTGWKPNGEVDDVVKGVCEKVAREAVEKIVQVESIQDEIERVLLEKGFVDQARAFISFRNKKEQERKERTGADERRIEKFQKSAKESSKYFEGNPLGEFVYLRTYARWIEEEGRRETWIETVDRYLSFMRENLGDRLEEKEYDELREAILKQEVMPSMRLLQFSGKPARKCNVVAYNCSWVTPSKIEDFGEILYLSACGTGVGFSAETMSAQQLPVIKRQTGKKLKTFIIGDSREGWADALIKGMKTWYSGKDIEFDYTLIRPAGARLRTMGGKSSGPGPLKSLLEFTREKILARQGRRLTNLDVHDIVCKIGEVIVSGGTRRTALLSMSDLDDVEIRDAKNGAFYINYPHRSLANNSAAYIEKPSSEEFLKEWAALVASGSGERGIFNRGGLMTQMPKRRIEKWEEMGHVVDGRIESLVGTNPCTSQETRVVTRNGVFQIKDLVGKTVDIWDGVEWRTIDNFRVTGENQEVLKITLHDGSHMRVTPYHKMILADKSRIEARELQPGDKLMIADSPEAHGEIEAKGAYIKGFLAGDGSNSQNSPLLWLYDSKYSCEKRLIESAKEVPVGEVNTNAVEEVSFAPSTYNRRRMNGLAVRKEELLKWATEAKKRIPDEVFQWDKKSKAEFIAGAMDADGTAFDTKNGFAYQICSIHREWLLDFQELLKTFGVQSTLRLMKAAGKKDFGDGYGEYNSQDCYRLTISQGPSKKLSEDVSFSRLVSFRDKSVSYNLRPRWNKVVSIVPDGIEEKVYCCTVEGTHSFTLGGLTLVGQCGEIVLLPNSFCNLSEVVARSHDTEESLLRKIRLATILGTYQATLTDFKYISSRWKENAEAERLLGVSITGQWDSKVVRTPEMLKALKNESLKVNRAYAKRFGIAPSVCVTTTKPSGTVSQTVDCSSGMHPRYAPYYIRRIRISATDSLFKMLRDQGVPFSPEVGQTMENATTFVLEFPVKSPKGSIYTRDLTALDQLEYWKVVKTNYTEHNPSVTISVGDDEWIDVASWLHKNWDIVGGLSFLPRSDHVYSLAPYEEITKEQYEELVKRFVNVDYSKLTSYELQDETELKKELACAGGTCEIN
jgi:ribonucleotide reductase class II